MTPATTHISARGKVLLTGEYAVLAGATALAFPSFKGQSIEFVFTPMTNRLDWQSEDADGIWFSASLSIHPLAVLTSSEEGVATRLLALLQQGKIMNPLFLEQEQGLLVKTVADFPKGWGLGTSSTLIYLIARWASVDPFVLLQATLGGSGYDVACAGSDSPILYRLDEGQPNYHQVLFNPSFLDALYLVYSGKKQHTASEIEKLGSVRAMDNGMLDAITSISHEVLSTVSLEEFNRLLSSHEQLISSLLHRPTIQESLFPDFPGLAKSLGAWGGDLLLFTWEDDPDALKRYLKEKGLDVVIPFRDLLLTGI